MSNDFMDRLKQRLQLDKENGWVFGVCAGLANALRFDPVFVRVGVIVVGLFYPKTIIAAYLIAWLILDDRSIYND